MYFKNSQNKTKPNAMRYIYFVILSCVTSLVSAQADSLLLTKNYKFRDGIYLSFKDFQTNTPSFAWDSIRANVYTNPQNFITRIQYIQTGEDDSSQLDLKQVWGVSIDGIPYVNINEELSETGMTTFAGLQLRGKICYFEYQIEQEKEIEMSAYNPLTGQAFRTSNIKRMVTVYVQKMLHFETGEIQGFTVDNLMNWISDDSNLVESMSSLTYEEADEKLFKCLLIYVDRTPIYFEEPKQN